MEFGRKINPAFDLKKKRKKEILTERNYNKQIRMLEIKNITKQNSFGRLISSLSSAEER